MGNGSGVSRAAYPYGEGSSGVEDRFTVESVTSPSGLTHQLWNKNDHV
jgi:hypothetical protein